MLWIVYALCFLNIFGFTQSKYCGTETQDDIKDPECGVNEVMNYTRITCPPQACESLYLTYSCLDAPPEPGCECIKGYLRNRAGVCIPTDECPKKPDLPKCGPNEIPAYGRTICPPQTCESTYRFYECKYKPPEPGCDCIDGYLRNTSGICIPSEECPPAPILPKCGENEVPTTDRSICPPQVCERAYILYTCELRPPEPGCDCIENYLRNASGICIPSYECPPYVPVKPACGPNEEYADVRITCPPQICESKYKEYSCLADYPEPGCNCINGYLRNSSGICIPSGECPEPIYNITCGPFEIKKEKRTQCPPQTCVSMYSINFCMSGPPEPGCDCIDGYLRDEDGVCIPSEECPIPPGFSDGNFDDGEDYTDCDSSDDNKQKTDSRSSSESKIAQSHLYDSENSLKSSSDKIRTEEVSTSKTRSSISKSYSFSSASSKSFSAADYVYDY